MSSGIWSATAGAMGQLTHLEVSANNLANASTPAFRAERAIFREVLGRARSAKGMRGEARAYSYTLSDRGGIDSSSGTIQQTGRSLDGALRGDGYFVLKTPSGERYTRLGSIQMSKEGTLETTEGIPFLDSGRQPIQVPPNSAQVALGADGTILVNGVASGKLLVVTFPKGAPLARDAGVMFRAEGGATPSPIDPVIETESLEMSNVSVVRGMVDIIAANRGFEACERAIEAFKEADRRATMGLMKE